MLDNIQSIKKDYQENKQLFSIFALLYKWKKLPKDLFGRKFKVTGTVGDMPVDLTIEQEPESLETLNQMSAFMKEKARLEKIAMKKNKK